ncbi:20636_t:CDS:1, partial [Racocetra persica]
LHADLKAAKNATFYNSSRINMKSLESKLIIKSSEGRISTASSGKER